ncbi:MAG: DNA repair protein RadC [Methylotenera sp.]|nr:DNA repair protein RadC [Methylotenera sp.]
MADLHSTTLTVSENRAVYKALKILEQKLLVDETVFNSPDSVRNFLKLKLGFEEREVFSVMFLDAQSRLIEYANMFYGTVHQTVVYPREVVKKALSLNAASVVFSHNHPSGVALQSEADELITKQLENALNLVDVRVLDHIIVAGNKTLSFAERGLL